MWMFENAGAGVALRRGEEEGVVAKARVGGGGAVLRTQGLLA